jgi:hypothetical protein
MALFNFNSNPSTFDISSGEYTEPKPYLDGTDAYANNNRTVVSFLHIPSDRRVSFKAMITTFSDSFTSQWSGEDVYGRGDPIQIFKSTKRSITLGFDVVASTDNEAYQNLARIQELSQFTYPSYTGVEAQTIAQAPLVRVGFMNIITDNDDNVVDGQRTSKTKGGDGTPIPVNYNNAAESGLVCAITSLNYSSMGFEKDNSNTVIGKGMALPRVINVSLSLEPLHRHQLGWLGSDFSKNNFPYGIGEKNTDAGSDQDWEKPEISKKKYELKGGNDIYGKSVSMPTMAAATKRAAAVSSEDDSFSSLYVSGKVLAQTLDRDFIGADAYGALYPEIQNIRSGMDYLNNPTDPDNPGVLQTLNQRQLEKQGTQQQIDMANARYNSLGGQIRYNRDQRLAGGDGIGTQAGRARAKQNIDASGQTLSDFDQPIDIGYSPTRGDYS